MVAPSHLAAAMVATDRSARTARMAEIMARREAGEGACTFAHLCAAGFTPAEIEAYRDDARAILSGRVPQDAIQPAGRAEGIALAAEALAIRARRPHPWAMPIIGETAGGLA